MSRTSASFLSARAGSPSLVGPQVRPVRHPGPATRWWWGRLLPIRFFPAPIGADQVPECELRPWVTFPESAGVTHPPGHQDVPAGPAEGSVRTWYHRCRASPREDTEHTRAHTCSQSHTHTHTHAVTWHTRAHTCSVTHACMCTITRAHSCGHTHTSTHTHMHTHTHVTHTLSHMHTLTHFYRPTQ